MIRIGLWLFQAMLRLIPGEVRAELGVRLALGAEPRQVVRMVVGQGLRLVAIGAALGFPVAIAGARLVAARVVGVNPWDPAVLGSAAALMATIGIAAAFVPGRRAARVDPRVALSAN